MSKLEQTINYIVQHHSCFDLQFRKDTRHERTNSPTYYRWKLQFVITMPKGDAKVLEQVKRAIQCGSVTVIKEQARLSVQNIDDMYHSVVPYLRTRLADEKKKEFELWKKAVEIIKKNKGTAISKWEKSDLLSLMAIQQSCAKYKQGSRQPKWLAMAKTISGKEHL